MTLDINSQISILYQFLTNVMTKCAMIYIAFRNSLFNEILTWNHYLIMPLYQLLLNFFTELIYDVTLALIYFWKLCWHPKGRSIWKILNDPEGGAVRIETTVNPDGTKSERTRHRARSESKTMIRKRKGKPRGKNIEVDPIKGYPSDLYMHLYYQSEPAIINQMDDNASAEDNPSSKSLAQSMAMTIHFASTFHSAMNLIFPKPPKGAT